jgi:hypothetical protein
LQRQATALAGACAPEAEAAALHRVVAGLLGADR